MPGPLISRWQWVQRERERMDIYAETCSKSCLFSAGQVVFEAGEKGAAVWIGLTETGFRHALTQVFLLDTSHRRRKCWRTGLSQHFSMDPEKSTSLITLRMWPPMDSWHTFWYILILELFEVCIFWHCNCVRSAVVCKRQWMQLLATLHWIAHISWFIIYHGLSSFIIYHDFFCERSPGLQLHGSNSAENNIQIWSILEHTGSEGGRTCSRTSMKLRLC